MAELIGMDAVQLKVQVLIIKHPSPPCLTNEDCFAQWVLGGRVAH